MVKESGYTSNIHYPPPQKKKSHPARNWVAQSVKHPDSWFQIR